LIKSDYVREEHENILLQNGYICVGEEGGVQTWVDMQSQGTDILHIVHQYPLFVDEMDAISPSDAAEVGAIYFIVQTKDGHIDHKGTWVSRAIAQSQLLGKRGS